MLNIWTEKSGYTFGTIQERSIVNLALPISYYGPTVRFTVISGSIPPGLQIVNSSIQGTPYEVARVTTFTFCIRATDVGATADRTFTITVDGADAPEILNAEGTLPIGANNAFFILDSSVVDFQIDAIDYDTATGQTLKYFISSGDGSLPPGLAMSRDGQITGVIKPLQSTRSTTGDGSFATDLYDSVGYDFGVRPDNGYDSFVYDTVTFDFNLPVVAPKKLNRNYEFIVSVSDGDTVTKKKFKIYVVGDDFLRADNTLMSVGTGVFTSDGTFIRKPVWITPEDLGIRRANNYLTILLDTYEVPVVGQVVYSLDASNPDLTTSELPPGLQFDLSTSELFGVVPYQPAITKTYKFTITATRFGLDNETASTKRTFVIRTLGEVESVMNWVTPESLGAIDANYISVLKIQATSTIEDATILYTVSSGNFPPGLTLQLNGEIIGKVTQYGVEGNGLTTFTDTLTLTVLNGGIAETAFFESTIDGGSANVSGTELSGGNAATIYQTSAGITTFDGGSTSFDRSYSFVITAQDQYNYSSISRTFTLRINTPDDRLYSNVVARTFMNQDKRSLFNSFINDSGVFISSSIYRPSDANFGIQRDLKMTIYGGIETKTAAEYISAIGLNHKRKRFTFGNVKSAKAKIPGTNTVVYEVIYVEMFDPLEKGKLYLNSTVTRTKDPKKISVDNSSAIWANNTETALMNSVEPYLPRPDHRITIDQTTIAVSDPNTSKYFPNSISLWRQQLKTVGLTERNYLPLWMRSVQDTTRQELGFVLAVPICFCNPGTSADILLNIKFSRFDFKNLDYTVDRYIIDSVTGDSSDKYLVFKDDKVTIS